ncbi:MAG: hypothetical protein WC975_01485 [Phycisphaerae bacterium]
MDSRTFNRSGRILLERPCQIRDFRPLPKLVKGHHGKNLLNLDALALAGAYGSRAVKVL